MISEQHYLVTGEQLATIYDLASKLMSESRSLNCQHLGFSLDCLADQIKTQPILIGVNKP